MRSYAIVINIPSPLTLATAWVETVVLPTADRMLVTLVPGPWSLVPGPWSLVPGPWSLVPGPWDQERGVSTSQNGRPCLLRNGSRDPQHMKILAIRSITDH